MTSDNRNVIDEFKGQPQADIIRALDTNGVKLEVAIENIERDFNMGSIVRTANAFGVRHVHVIGRRQWNKRGAMATDKYMHMEYHPTVAEFVQAMRAQTKRIVCVDNVQNAEPLQSAEHTLHDVLVFGSEGAGISPTLLSNADSTVTIKQQGSTRSMNVAAAAAVAMYEWCR